MNDVAPILLESVQKCFDKWFYTDREVKEIYKKVRKGTATFKEMKRFSERAGAILVESLKATFSADKLPDGKLYQNIAEKVITPMLEQNHGLINEVCGYVADDLNRAARIGTKAVTAVFNADKAETVAQIAANCGEVVPGNKAAQLVENATMSMVDDFIQANLEFQKKLGLVPQIQRIYHGGKNRCEFCASLQYTGEYNGPGMPSEIFRRHRDCRCTLIYKPQKGPYQDPWSKAEKDDYQKLVTEQRKYLTELDKMSAGERRIERNAKARAQRRTLYGPAEWNSRKAQQIIIADNRASGKEYRVITQGKIIREKGQSNETLKRKLKQKEEYKSNGRDVTKRYLADASPGKGNIEIEQGYLKDDRPDEIGMANWIHKTLGGDIVLKAELFGQKNPDYEWLGTLWDLKTVSTEKSANSALKRGMKQIKENPGGIILDYGDKQVDIDELMKVIDRRMEWYPEESADIIIISHGRIQKVLRY